MSTAVAEPAAARGLARPLAVAVDLPVRVDAWLEERRGLAWAMTTLLFAFLAVVVVVPAATGPGGVSPLDEYVYTDALDKAARGELSNTGDKVDRYARQVMACRGVIGLQPPNGACGFPQPDASLPLGGDTSADIHAPTYFFLTAAGAKVVLAVGLTDDLLIAGRLVGALWLALGMLSLVALGRAWGAGWVMPVLTTAAIACSPLIVSVSGFVSPDALGLLVGCGVLLAATYWQQGRLPNSVLLAAALLPAFVKVPFVLAPLFAGVMLLVAGLAGQIPWRRALIGASILVGGAGAGAVLWQEIRASLAVAVPNSHPDASAPSVKVFITYLGYYLDTIPVTSGAPIPVSIAVVIAVQPLSWLLLGAALGGLLLRRRDDPLLPVCWAGTTGMVLGSMVLSFIVLIASGGGFLVGTPRYGLALLPLFAVPLMCTRHPAAVVALLASASASALAHMLLW